MKITSKSLSIVTGGTGGLGKSISNEILESGGKLLFIARDLEKIKIYENELKSKFKSSFFKMHANLSLKEDLEKTKAHLYNIIDSNNEIEEIFLFNNASIIDPIALIEDVGYEEIISSLTLNIASPFILTSILLQINKVKKFCRINIINISSGVSINPVKGWSSYCISKAGLNMLSKCISSESSSMNTIIFSLSINPGPINTEMQKKIRSADAMKIPASKKFELMFNEGKLQEPHLVAKKLFRIMAENKYSNGDFIDFNVIN